MLMMLDALRPSPAACHRFDIFSRLFCRMLLDESYTFFARIRRLARHVIRVANEEYRITTRPRFALYAMFMLRYVYDFC